MLNHRSNNECKFIAYTGMALGEYALVIALVFCACMISVLGLGQGVNGLMTGISSEIKQYVTPPGEAQATANVLKGEDGGNSHPVSQAEGENAIQNSAKSKMICGSDWCVMAPGLTGKYISTAGSNGNRANSPMHVAANIYTQIAEILEQRPDTDPGLIALLTDMANRGHSLADAQRQLTGSGGYNGMKKGANGLKNNLGAFKEAAQELKQYSADLPPDIRAVLDNASRVIIGIADSYKVKYTRSAKGNNRIGYTHNKYKISLTRVKSNKICGSGGDESQCIR